MLPRWFAVLMGSSFTVLAMGYQARPSNYSAPRRGLQDARSYQFVQDLEQCIRETATEVALQYPSWGDNCMPGTYIVDAQAAVYSKTLSPIMEKHGYTGALWCAFFSIRMFHDPDPNDPQPNQPFYKLWYESLVCPWDLGVCGDEPLGQNGYEGDGVPTEWAGDRQHPQYIGEDRRAMSCGLCGHLLDVFGKPPHHVADTVPDPLPQGIWEYADGGHMDIHPFGAWLANDHWLHNRDLATTVGHINTYKASNGEEIHGFTWQYLRLLAYDTHQLSGTRRPDEQLSIDEAGYAAALICESTWYLTDIGGGQSHDDCAHAVGHGMFYYFMEIGLGAQGCWTDHVAAHTPGWLSAKELLKWRWLCTTGIYHSALNTLSINGYHAIIQRGERAEDFVCKKDEQWDENAFQFERCAAGLGAGGGEWKIEMTKQGICPLRHDAATGAALAPEAWELHQLQQPQMRQRTCYPKEYYATANDFCPAAFQAHFPCDASRADYKHCQNGWHNYCEDPDVLRKSFACDHIAPQYDVMGRLAVNEYWDGSPDAGLWGGECLCPDGHKMMVGDNNDNCGSLACVNGQPGQCVQQAGSWSFRKVVCADPITSPSPPPPAPSPSSPSPSPPPPAPSTPSSESPLPPDTPLSSPPPPTPPVSVAAASPVPSPRQTPPPPSPSPPPPSPKPPPPPSVGPRSVAIRSTRSIKSTAVAFSTQAQAEEESSAHEQLISAIEAAFDPSSSLWPLGPIAILGAGLCCGGLVLGGFLLFRICCRGGRRGRGRTSKKHHNVVSSYVDDDYEDEIVVLA